MSGFYITKYEDRVEILTDGATYEHDGTIVKIGKKIWASDRLPMVYVGRGSSAAVDMIGVFLGIYGHGKTFDEAFMGFKEILEARRNAPGDQVKMDGVVAGMSETLGPVAFYFHSYPDPDRMAGMEPFTFYTIDVEFLAAPGPSNRDLHNSGLPMYWSIDGLAKHGGTFFDAVRQNKMIHLAHPDEPEIYGIGGHVDHTVINLEGVTTTRILEWPDEVGKKIEPFKQAA